MSYRRALLAFVLGAIGVTAALGLYAVLVPDFGDLQAKVLGTSASISGASVLVLAVTPAWERRLVRPLPVVGAALTALVFCLVVGGMWTEAERDAYWKTMGTAAFLAAWAVLVSLLALATLPRRHRWTFVAAAALTFALAAVGVGAVWSEADSDVLGRVVGALAVLSAAFVLAVPVVHRATRDENRRARPAAGGGFCPRCGAPVAAAVSGEPVSCGSCGARFRVEYRE